MRRAVPCHGMAWHGMSCRGRLYPPPRSTRQHRAAQGSAGLRPPRYAFRHERASPRSASGPHRRCFGGGVRHRVLMGRMWRRDRYESSAAPGASCSQAIDLAKRPRAQPRVGWNRRHRGARRDTDFAALTAVTRRVGATTSISRRKRPGSQQARRPRHQACRMKRGAASQPHRHRANPSALSPRAQACGAPLPRTRPRGHPPSSR